MRLQKREIRRARIEIIPMIDTIFFLLVFFMISSLSMVRMKAIMLSLPKNVAGRSAAASSGPGNSKTAAMVVVTITSSDQYYVGKTHIAPTDLGPSLASSPANSGAVVVLNLAKTQSTQTLIHVMDTINALRNRRGEPIKALIATEPVDQEGNAVGSG